MTEDVIERDYPFYRGDPVTLTGMQWLVVMVGVGLAVWVLLGHFAIFSQGYMGYGTSVLMTVLPLLGLILVAPRHWTALFRKIGWKDIGWMFAFAALNAVIAIPLGFLLVSLVEAQVNPGVDGLTTATNFDRTLFFLASLPQLMGEELVSILPFLAILYFLTQKLGFSRTAAVITAWIATAVWFAAIHLPTYNYNIIQCLIAIGGARLVLTLAYMKTKNLWVSFGAHVINDWMTFGLAVLASVFGSSA